MNEKEIIAKYQESQKKRKQIENEILNALFAVVCIIGCVVWSAILALPFLVTISIFVHSFFKNPSTLTIKVALAMMVLYGIFCFAIWGIMIREYVKFVKRKKKK